MNHLDKRSPVETWKRSISSRLNIRFRLVILVLVVSVALPMALGLIWGPVFDDDTYVLLRYTQNLSTGDGLVFDLPPGVDVEVLPETSSHISLKSLLFVLALWLPARLELSLPIAALVLSSMGWGVAVIGLWCVCLSLRRHVAGLVSALLLVLSPTMFASLGTETPWTLGIGLVAIACTVYRRWRILPGALALLLMTRLDWGTLALACLLVIVYIKECSGIEHPVSAIVAVAAAVGAWLVLASNGAASLAVPSPSGLAGAFGFRWLLAESEFYWLFLPLAATGAAGALASGEVRHYWWMVVLALAAFALSEHSLAAAWCTMSVLFLVGLGIDSGVHWIGKWADEQGVAEQSRRVAAILVVAALTSPLVFSEINSIGLRYVGRPIARESVSAQAGAWLHAVSDSRATILGPIEVGYRADRPTIPWTSEMAGRPNIVQMTELLAISPVSYCVIADDFTGSLFTGTGFFQDSYDRVVRFGSAYDNRSPLTVWRYAYGEAPEPVDATFGDSIKLLSAASASRLVHGENLVVRLYWQAVKPPEEDYVVFVHLFDPNGAAIGGHDGAPSDGLYPTSTWLPGDVVPDIHHIAFVSKPTSGTHQLLVGMYSWPSIERLPVRDGVGAEQINRILLLKTIEVTQ